MALFAKEVHHRILRTKLFARHYYIGKGTSAKATFIQIFHLLPCCQVVTTAILILFCDDSSKHLGEIPSTHIFFYVNNEQLSALKYVWEPHFIYSLNTLVTGNSPGMGTISERITVSYFYNTANSPR